MQGYFFEDFKAGAAYDTYSRTITEGDHSLFCSLVGYHVPLFIDAEYAKRTPYGQRICPSALVMSFSTAMTETLFRDNVVALVSVNNGRFFAPLFLGDTIRTRVEVLSSKVTSDASRGAVVFRDSVTNQHDKVIFQIEKTVLIKRRA
jgi:3-hydroxybutyryl-CoA dehydratase